jgi:hypothetical protein
MPLLSQQTQSASVYLISWSTVLHKKLMIIWLIKELSMFYVTCSSQTPVTSSLSISLKFTLILSLHICLLPEEESFLQISYFDILCTFLISSKGVECSVRYQTQIFTSLIPTILILGMSIFVASF